MQFRTFELCSSLQWSSEFSNQFSTAAPCYAVQCSAGRSNFAILVNADRDSRTRLCNAIDTFLCGLRLSEFATLFRCGSGQSHLLYISMQRRTFEFLSIFQWRVVSIQPRKLGAAVNGWVVILDILICCTFQCSLGLTNFATRFNAVHDHRTLLYFSMQLRTFKSLHT